MPKRLSLIGKKFGRLTVIEDAGSANGLSTWKCRCDCGSEIIVPGKLIKRGTYKSCGCLKSEQTRLLNLSHGKSGTRTFNIWKNMRQRCLNKNNPRYPGYGGRGIKICDRWKDYVNFLKDMGEAPNKFSIERKDNDGNYCPENCVWADNRTQCRNTRRNRSITFEGRTQCISAWADELGIDPAGMHRRLANWPIARALTERKRSAA